MLKGLKNQFRLSATAFIILGVILIIFPGLSLRLASLVIGILTLVYGVTKIYAYVKGNTTPFDLIFGIILTLMGLVLIFSFTMILSMLPIILGIYVIIEGVTELKSSLSMKQAGYGRWWVTMLLSIAILILGAVMIFNPFRALTTFVRILGVTLIIDGVATHLSIADRK